MLAGVVELLEIAKHGSDYAYFLSSFATRDRERVACGLTSA